MKTEATWKRVQVFVGETDHYRGHTLFEAIVSMLHAEGVSGATAKGTLTEKRQRVLLKGGELWSSID